MRLGPELRGREPPDVGEDGIEQPEPPVGAEHRHRLGQMVERLALQLGQRGEPAFERICSVTFS